MYFDLCGNRRYLERQKQSYTYPHAKLLHPVSLLQSPIRKPETLENLQSAALQSVGLAIEDFGATFVYDACIDAEVGHPCCTHESILNQQVLVRRTVG